MRARVRARVRARALLALDIDDLVAARPVADGDDLRAREVLDDVDELAHGLRQRHRVALLLPPVRAREDRSVAPALDLVRVRDRVGEGLRLGLGLGFGLGLGLGLGFGLGFGLALDLLDDGVAVVEDLLGGQLLARLDDRAALEDAPVGGHLLTCAGSGAG